MRGCHSSELAVSCGAYERFSWDLLESSCGGPLAQLGHGHSQTVSWRSIVRARRSSLLAGADAARLVRMSMPSRRADPKARRIAACRRPLRVDQRSQLRRTRPRPNHCLRCRSLRSPSWRLCRVTEGISTGDISLVRSVGSGRLPSFSTRLAAIQSTVHGSESHWRTVVLWIWTGPWRLPRTGLPDCRALMRLGRAGVAVQLRCDPFRPPCTAARCFDNNVGVVVPRRCRSSAALGVLLRRQSSTLSASYRPETERYERGYLLRCRLMLSFGVGGRRSCFRMGCRSRGRMIRRSGCSSAIRRSRRIRCRLVWRGCWGIRGRIRNRTGWMGWRMRTGLCVCRR